MKGALAIRLAGWGIALTLIALPIVGVLEGWFAASRWPVRYLKVEAEFQHVGAEQIRAAVTPLLGAGFFALDLGAAQKAVAALPWVQRVEARKRWPDTLVLRVYELQPFAHWGQGRLIGRDGRVFAAPGADAIEGLPKLSGPDDRLADVVTFYTQVQKAFAADGMRVAAVDLSERGSWSLTLANGAAVMIGRDHPQERLQRFLLVYPTLMTGRSAGFEYADLRYTNGFAVKWPVPPAGAPAKPAAATGNV